MMLITEGVNRNGNTPQRTEIYHQYWISRVDMYQTMRCALRTAASGGSCAEICREERPGGAAANQNQYPKRNLNIELPTPAYASGSGQRRLREMPRSACPAVLPSFGFIVRLRRLRRFSPGNGQFRVRQ